MKENKDILLLGGTGAMGVVLTKILSDQGNNVYVTSRKERNGGDTERVHYLKGNAHNIEFITNVLCDKSWDAVVDFMVYSTCEFKERIDLFLNNTTQYIFISSARVYAESDGLLTEQSNRLLDTSTDLEYLKTDEYALAKARQEDMLFNSLKNNWTIIRPSVTYNSNRLQLGVLEKEHWLYRALHGRTIVFSEDIGDKLTALTSGYDVANGIAAIIGEENALKKCFHITDSNSYTWNSILEIYLDIIQKLTGMRPNVKMTGKTSCFDIGWNKYQIIYCRYYNRTFDNAAISKFTDINKFSDIHSGLENAVKEFLANPSYGEINWRLEAINDKICKEHTPISEMPSAKSRVQYCLYRYLPTNLANLVFYLIKCISK